MADEHYQRVPVRMAEAVGASFEMEPEYLSLAAQSW